MNLRLPLLVVILATAALTAQGQKPAPLSGLDLGAFDRSIRPQDDLFRHANGSWLDRTEIPAERVTYGAFIEIAERTERDLRAIVEAAAAAPDRRDGSPAQQIGDLYASMLDIARIEALGLSPIADELERIEAIRDARDVAAVAGHLAAIGAGPPFAGSVGEDPGRPGTPVVRFSQGGTLLPDRDYYLKDDPGSRDIRERYEQYLAQIFTLARRRDAAGDAKAVLAVEIQLARIQWPQAEARDQSRIHSRFSVSELPALMPGFDWIAWAKPQGIGRRSTVILSQPSFFQGFAALVPATAIDTWKAWLASRFLTLWAPYINRAFGDARFDFFGGVLSGQEEPIIRWKRGVSLVSSYLGDAVGRLYVEKHFPPASKSRVERLAANVIRAYRDAVAQADWMSPATKAESLDKLARLTMKIGYPDRWRSYRGLVVKPGELVKNIQRAQQFDNRYRMRRFDDRRIDEWLMTPQTVNAYYNPALNEIVLPAAILQPPLFTMEADDAVNYGGIGAILGHELSHGFDERGRQFDASGRLRRWWKSGDVEAFDARSRMIEEQFSGFSPMPGVRVNGALTRGENVGDLVGLSVAYRAYKLSLGNRRSPVIDGFTGEQRFFLNWAQMWRGKMRDEYLRQWVLWSQYPPPQYRANGPVSNLPGFYEAFNVTPGDRLFRPPDQRVRIW